MVRPGIRAEPSRLGSTRSNSVNKRASATGLVQQSSPKLELGSPKLASYSFNSVRGGAGTDAGEADLEADGPGRFFFATAVDSKLGCFSMGTSCGSRDVDGESGTSTSCGRDVDVDGRRPAGSGSRDGDGDKRERRRCGWTRGGWSGRDEDEQQ